MKGDTDKLLAEAGTVTATKLDFASICMACICMNWRRFISAWEEFIFATTR